MLQFLKLRKDADLPLPTRQTPGAAGFDLAAAIDEPLSISPGERVLIPTGWAVAIPDGFEGQVRPRSGLALKKGLTVLNSPGTIDADYRGEIKVILINLGTETVSITRGERIAQMIIAKVEYLTPVLVETLDETSRGSGGFGSTSEIV